MRLSEEDEEDLKILQGISRVRGRILAFTRLPLCQL